MAKKKNKIKKTSSALAWIFSIMLMGLIAFAGYGYYIFLFPNIVSNDSEDEFVYIKLNQDITMFYDLLEKKGTVKSIKSFRIAASMLNLPEHLNAGRYRIRDGMSNFELIRLIRSGKEVPVRFTINNIVTIEELAGLAGKKLEPDSADFLRAFKNSEFVEERGFSGKNVLCFFIPDTYEFYWNITIDDFLEKMGKAYDKFWNESRLKKAAAKGLTPTEVGILASIIQNETNYKKEYSTIAGVYLNRLKNGKRLEADPTIRFLIKDRKVQRVYYKDLEIVSPYNTYRNTGLPPGPIALPKIKAIDGVLNAEKHNFFYFCANSNMSGTHVFAKTYDEHLQNRKKYQQVLNQRNIK